MRVTLPASKIRYGDGMNQNRKGVTSRDVAVLAGVSQSAVSRAFTAGSSLSSKKRERILAAAETLNYVPNSIASSLITRRTNTIAIILGSIENPFYLGALKSFLSQLQSSGRKALTFTVEPGASSDDVVMQVLGHQVDGIILTAAQLSTRSVNLCRNRGIPIILFNRYIPGSEAAVVRCDNYGGGKALASQFLAAGALSFAIIKGDPMGTTSQDRLDGFLDGLWEGNIPRNSVTEMEGHSTYEGGFQAIVDRYDKAETILPDAVFGISDIMAIGAIDALRFVLKVKIPEDVMIGGFDGIPEGARSPYRLTTMRQPMEEMVTKTLALLESDEPFPKATDNVDLQLTSKLIWRDTIRQPLP